MQKNCDGTCVKHFGEVRHVTSGECPKRHTPWDWWYCEEALAEDKRRGFTVRDFETNEIL